MNKYSIPLIAVLLAVTFSCKKYHSIPDPNPPSPHEEQPPVGLDDARTVLLKDVEALTLPSPYFHFVYDNQRYVRQINFASGLKVYNVEYENKRVKKMFNTVNRNSFFYHYRNNQVAEINEFSGLTGDKKFSYRFSYNVNNQLMQVLWFEYSNTQAGNIYKKSDLTYHADGNVASIKHYFNKDGDQLKLIKTDEFNHYDTNTNIDDFYLLEEFFDSFLFLPQVKLQKNNARLQVITSEKNDYEVTYAYQFQNNLPVRRSGVITQTRGTELDESLRTTTLFNYY